MYLTSILNVIPRGKFFFVKHLNEIMIKKNNRNVSQSLAQKNAEYFFIKNSALPCAFLYDLCGKKIKDLNFSNPPDYSCQNR